MHFRRVFAKIRSVLGRRACFSRETFDFTAASECHDSRKAGRGRVPCGTRTESVGKRGMNTFRRHEQKDGGLASDEGVAELVFARGMGPGRSPFMAQAGQAGRLADRSRKMNQAVQDQFLTERKKRKRGRKMEEWKREYEEEGKDEDSLPGSLR